MLNLPDITLIALTSVRVEETIKALEYSCNGINEDGFICVNYRHKYLEDGCNFADIDVAKYFSKETEITENVSIEPFAFHNYIGKNNKYPKF